MQAFIPVLKIDKHLASAREYWSGFEWMPQVNYRLLRLVYIVVLKKPLKEPNNTTIILIWHSSVQFK